MIVSVSMVRDTLENVQLFVEGNLSGGIDHMVILFDEPAPEIEEWLSEVPEVTSMVTDDVWWGDERPDNMSFRLLVNWNAVAPLMVPFEDVDWFFHCDGDEVYRIDKTELAAVPKDHHGVVATVHEVVHRREWDGDPTLYKRPLNENELSLLHLLGGLKAPDPTEYFRGYGGLMYEGKPGMRPSLDIGLHWHQPMPLHEKVDLKIAGLDSLRIFHMESPRLTDFLDRWHYHFVPGRVYGKPLRLGTQQAAQALYDLDTPAAVRDEVLTEIFDRTVPEPLELLQKLGLVVEMDPRHGGQEPDRAWSAEFGGAIKAVLEEVRRQPRNLLHWESPTATRAKAVQDAFSAAGL